MHAILPLLQSSDFPRLARDGLDTLQVNLGYRCNQSCQHCHVAAGPNRRETMDASTAGWVVQFLQTAAVKTLDLTGGAPEVNAQFRPLVEAARALGLHVIDRCNLTILEEPGYEDLADFLAERRVEIVASLPCYLEENVDAQRGPGVFRQSIAALRKLNRLGYAAVGSGMMLHLVFNPQGPSLPPPQAELEADYRRELRARYGVEFNRLYALANMPIQRFGSQLVSKGQFPAYLALLRGAHRAENLTEVMCRRLVSIDWQGYAYDCDFNQMLGLPLAAGIRRRTHVRDLIGKDLAGQPITVADHCYGCTAGAGSSCRGSLSA